MTTPLLNVHPSWTDVPEGIETSPTWRWFYLRHWIDRTEYESLLRHFEDADAPTAEELLNTLYLAAEALLRTGAAAERCGTKNVEWARRTGLASFGAAKRGSSLAEDSFLIAVIRHLTTLLPDSSRQIALLALPRQPQADLYESISNDLERDGPTSPMKLQRLLSLCGARLKSHPY